MHVSLPRCVKVTEAVCLVEKMYKFKLTLSERLNADRISDMKMLSKVCNGNIDSTWMIQGRKEESYICPMLEEDLYLSVTFAFADLEKALSELNFFFS